MVMRVGAGQWSDKLRTRIVPLARIGIAMSVSLAVVTGLLNAPLRPARPGLRRSRVADDGLERRCLRRRRRAGGPSAKRFGARVQQTVLSLAGVGTPLAFAAVVSSGSWSLAYGLAALFPIAGWLVLRTLPEPEKARLPRRLE